MIPSMIVIAVTDDASYSDAVDHIRVVGWMGFGSRLNALRWRTRGWRIEGARDVVSLLNPREARCRFVQRSGAVKDLHGVEEAMLLAYVTKEETGPQGK